MLEYYFENMFKNLHVPVVVCLNDRNKTIVYANNSALIYFDPLLIIKNLKNNRNDTYLTDLIKFSDMNALEILYETLSTINSVVNFPININTYDNKKENIIISANRVEIDDDEYFIMYFTISNMTNIAADNTNILLSIYHTAYHNLNVNDAINKILNIVGNYINVSRVYIFEEISAVLTRNTYEWCAKGIEPAIHNLQSLYKKDYNYDIIMENGMYITDDIRDLPVNDFEILNMQGIKSIAIIPLFKGDKGIGYIGYDDCLNYRKWSQSDVQLLNTIANVIVSLIERRNFITQEARSFAVLKTISDYIDNSIYVNDINTYEIIFVNNALAKSMNISPDSIIGKKCWQVLQKNADGPCEFCPLRHMINEHFEIVNKDYTWEFKNTVNNRCYIIKDSIIKWMDGRDVHIETATDITEQKINEDQLLYFASTDVMTGAYNREWGYKILSDIIDEKKHTEETVSICFVDLDGLKIVNDTYGHDEGDNMIITLIKTIRSCIRRDDIICRWGGDEFLVIIRRCEMEIAEKIMKKIQLILEGMNKNSKYDIAFSYGITSLPNDPDIDIDTIICEADKIMYNQKQSKKNNRQ